MELRTVFHDDIVNFDILAIDHIDQVWSVVLIVDVIFVVEEQYHPPMITSSINFATSAYFDVSAIIYLDEVPMSFSVSLTGPELDVFGC
jgi:hypothetical protein